MIHLTHAHFSLSFFYYLLFSIETMHSLGSIICLVATLTACLNLAKGNIRLEQTGWSVGKSESGNKYECPEGQIMIGREHNGDEDGPTSYLCAKLFRDGQWIGVTKDSRWSSPQVESSSTLTCNSGKFMIGREHVGDEHGSTTHLCGSLLTSSIHVESPVWSASIKEYDSSYTCPAGHVMTGRSHEGDENGKTQYQCSKVQ